MNFMIKLFGGSTKEEVFNSTLKAVNHAKDSCAKDWSEKMAKQEFDFLHCRLVTLNKHRDVLLELAEYNKKRRYKSSHMYEKANNLTAQILDIEGEIQRRKEM